MKRAVLFTIAIITSVCLANAIENNMEPVDTIYKLGGKILPVDVTKVTTGYVSFVYPGQPEVYTIERKQVQKIIFKNGRIEEYNKPVVMVLDKDQWEAVWLTEDKADITNMYKRGNISAKSPPSSRSAKAAKKGAIIRLQKKAANIKAQVVLVTHKQTTGGYGELPGYYIKGVAYGYEPFDEGEEETSDLDN